MSLMAVTADTHDQVAGGPAATVAHDQVPAAVGEALALLARPHHRSAASWAVQSAVWADRRIDDDDAAAWVEEELRVLEAVETVKAWADFQGLAALARMQEAVHEQVRAHNDDLEHLTQRPLLSPALVSVEALTATVDEAALATGLPAWEVARRLELAADARGRGARLGDAVAAGEVSPERALRIHRDTRRLGTEVGLAVSERLLAPGRDGSIRSHPAILRELRRQVAVHTPDPAQDRAAAIADRDATAVVDPDAVGTGSLLVTGEAGRVCAAIGRVDDLARRLRAAGDPRTLGQLRSDIAVDLLLYGWATPDPPAAERPRAANPRAANPGTASPGTASPGTAIPRAGIPEQSRTTFMGQPPPAHVTVVVSLTTLLGLQDTVAEIPGHGFIPAVQARQMAMADGSVWRRLVVDPVTGAALDLSTRRYRPTPAMADLIAARDGMCRGPGCTVPAERCDLDHDIPWPSGPTAIGNLSRKHRRHHNHKTRGTWTATTGDDGAITWRTRAKRRYVTRPRNYLDPLSQPVTEEDIEHALIEEPPPF